MRRTICFPPGTPPAAAAALTDAIIALNADQDYKTEAMSTIGFVPEWQAGPQIDTIVQKALSVPPEARNVYQRLHKGREQVGASTMLRTMLFSPSSAAARSEQARRAPTSRSTGKRLTLLINFAPGGPTDVEGRLLAKHIVKHIDGNPLIVVQNKDGASGMVGAAYLGEVGPKDGTMFGYLTGTSWNYVIDPAAFRVDFRSYDFIGAQPGNAVYYMRTDTPPGMKAPADLMKAQGLVVGGLGADSSKDLLQRLTFDMLGLHYRYVTGYRSSNTARLALQNGEINVHSESTPGYLGVVEPSLVKTGKVMPLWYDPTNDGKRLMPIDSMAHKDIATFPEFYKSVKGGDAVGPVVGGLQDQSPGRRFHAAPRRHAAGFAAGRDRGAAQGAARAQ